MSRSVEVWSPKPILPNIMLLPAPESPITNDNGAEQGMLGLYDDSVESLLEIYPSSGVQLVTALDKIAPLNGIPGFGDGWLLPHPQEFNSQLNHGLGHTQLRSISTPSAISLDTITLEDGTYLNEDEKKALDYFRTCFSLSQTTRDPQWSTTTLLLEHSVKCSAMLLHLILAVSLYDVQSRGDLPLPTDQLAQRHYESGARSLAKALENEEHSDHVAVLGSIYCVYVYMSRQAFLNSSKINRLSFTALGYIKRKGLDVLFLTPYPQSSAIQSAGADIVKAEQSLIARLIMWLFKIDAQCSFFECKPSLLEYFQTRQVLLDGIVGTSRLALQLNWGRNYPISQSIRDIESNMSIDMMMELLMMSHKISKYSQSSVFEGNDFECAELRNEIDKLEVVSRLCLSPRSCLTEQKYGAVFYYGSSEMTLQPAMKLNCATSATIFYATKIYLLRCGPSPFGAHGSPEATQALGQLLVFARHVCFGGAQQPVYEFQWSLFIACLETNDMIHQEWLESKICDTRFRGALERIFFLKRSTAGEVDLNIARRILQAS